MKIERLSQDKIRIFLTFDDLSERGIQKEDMWREVPKVHELFSEMMEQAYSELGFDVTGPLAVEVFSMPAQGMVVIVTKGMQRGDSRDMEEDSDEEVYEMEVTLETSDTISYMFRDFEHVVQAAKALHALDVICGAMYSYKDRWFLQMEPAELEEQRVATVIAVLSEYGEAASVTEAVLQEYGKTIFTAEAIKQLVQYFG
ncbi:genetic competence negative regulator [Paenibacillus sp. y28]|uniref:genetic competence negative regulator n=1 Tax=Paenibacillus sp. y28 TaxID=3129110 RepID=UPI00301962AB